MQVKNNLSFSRFQRIRTFFVFQFIQSITEMNNWTFILRVWPFDSASISAHWHTAHIFHVAGKGCGGYLTDYMGAFTSPMYPQNYRKNSFCVWTIDLHGAASPFLRFVSKCHRLWSVFLEQRSGRFSKISLLVTTALFIPPSRLKQSLALPLDCVPVLSRTVTGRQHTKKNW